MNGLKDFSFCEVAGLGCFEAEPLHGALAILLDAPAGEPHGDAVVPVVERVASGDTADDHVGGEQDGQHDERSESVVSDGREVDHLGDQSFLH